MCFGLTDIGPPQEECGVRIPTADLASLSPVGMGLATTGFYPERFSSGAPTRSHEHPPKRRTPGFSPGVLRTNLATTYSPTRSHE